MRSPSQRLRNLTTSRDGAERAFVAFVWAALSIALFTYVCQFARNVPHWDDYTYIPVLSGAQPFDLSWIVEQTLEHRFVLAKLIQQPLWLATHDFRTPMWIDAFALSALAGFYVLGIRRLRGHTRFSDAFLPLLLLNWGHYENLIFFVQLCFVLPVVLMSACVLLIANQNWRSPRGAIAFASCVLLMPLNGAMGVLMSPPLFAWSLYAAWKSRAERKIAIPLALGAAIGALFIALYFVHHEMKQVSTLPHSLETTLRGSFELLCTIFGPPASRLWPYPAIVVAVLCAGIAFLLAHALRTRPEERARAGGLLACLAAIGLLVVGIGYGRGVMDIGSGFSSRYCLLIAPALCIVYFALQIYAARFPQRFCHALLFVAACAAFFPNAEKGLEYAHERDAAADSFVADLSSGMRTDILVQRHAMRLYPSTEVLTRALSMMKDAGIGPYASLPTFAMKEPQCHEDATEPKLESVHDVTFEGDIGKGTTNDPFVVYALPKAMRICSIRVEYDIDNFAAGDASTQMFWRNSSSGEEFDGAKRNTTVTQPAGPQTQTFWIDATIDHFRFDPDVRPCTFRVRKITLLVENGP